MFSMRPGAYPFENHHTSRLLIAVAGAFLVVAESLGTTFAEEKPRFSDEKIVLSTIAGDLILGLYADIAPKHSAQIIRLVEAGVFDGTHFYRLHPDFVLQTSTAQDRLVPLRPEQAALIHPLSAEFSQRKHVRGVLSMARDDGKPDSAETSFSILLGDAPHLDQGYTVFGELLEGWDVVEEFLKVPQATKYYPSVRLTIQSARVSRESVATLISNRSTAIPVQIPSEVRADFEAQRSLEEPWNASLTPLLGTAAVGFLSVTLLNVVVCLLLWYSPSVRLSLSLLLISTLLGYVCFVMLAIPVGRREPLIGLGIMLGLVGQFKLMSLFDRLDRPQSLVRQQPS
jgi:cyclophilin family peptidyl-prolyl cis-trans isomerase